MLRWVAVLGPEATIGNIAAVSERPVWYLVPDGIVQNISKRGLYRDADPGLDGAIQPRPGL